MKPHSSTSNSKSNRRYLKKFAIFGALIILMFAAAFVCVNFLERITNDRSSTQKISMYQIEDFYALEENSLDVLIMGSSHAMCTYNPYALERHFVRTLPETADALPLSAYNLGTALQQPDTAYHLLREVYKTQKPHLLIYDLYFKVMQCEKTAEQAETVLMELKPSLNAASFWWNNLDGERRVNYLNNRINPFGRLFSIFSNWESARVASNEARNPNYRGKGFYVTEGVVSNELLKEERHPFAKEYVPYTERQIKYLKKLVALAESHGTRVIFVSAPIPPTVLGRIDYYTELNRDADALADELNVYYHDFALDQLSGKLTLSDQDFADQGHLNLAGADKFNNYCWDIINNLGKQIRWWSK